MVNQVLAQYEQMKSMMKTFGKMAGGKKGGFRMPPGMGGKRGFSAKLIEPDIIRFQ